MPSLESVDEMLDKQHKIFGALDRMKQSILQQEHAAMVDLRMREHGGKAHGDYDAEMSMYDDDKNQGYGGSEGKKRRGVCS